MSKSQVAVIGSGIIGLTTALEIQNIGHAVTIFAESLPGDKSSRYTSPWAGANHLSIADGDARKFALERETFDRFWKISGQDSEEAGYIMRVPYVIYYDDDMIGKTNLEHMPDFRPLSQEELVAPSVCGIAFTTITIDTATYLPYLLAQFLARGGRIHRVHVQHIDQVLLGAWGMPVPDALVVCAGIGARFLGGVEDPNVYPIRGQTVLIRAPWVREGCSTKDKEGDLDPTYIIPRPSGDVLLGGTLYANDWYPHPRPETGRAILARALALMPKLCPPNSSQPPALADVEALVIEHGCGLRPARKGGLRLERGVVQVSGSLGGGVVPIVYNYGHGGAGYQSSWGTARVATELLAEGLQARA